MEMVMDIIISLIFNFEDRFKPFLFVKFQAIAFMKITSSIEQNPITILVFLTAYLPSESMNP